MKLQTKKEYSILKTSIKTGIKIGAVVFVIFLVTSTLTKVVFVIFLVTSTLTKYGMDALINSVWFSILSALATSIISSICVSAFIYFKFFKRIPEETLKKVDDLLNARLNHEATNHHSVMQNLNPNNAHLSGEHDKIEKYVLSIAKNINDEKAERNNLYNSLTSEQKDIKRHIESLIAMEKQMEHQEQKIRQLVHEKQDLKQQLEMYQVKNHNMDHNFHRGMDDLSL